MIRLLTVLVLLVSCSPAASKPPSGFIQRSIGTRAIDVRVMGFESLTVPPGDGPVTQVKEPYDVIIVGGGLSGMAAAWFLREKNVIVLERQTTAGGLAFRGLTPEGSAYTRGAAYYSKPSKRGAMIYQELGFSPIEQTAIPEPIDSYWYKGKLIEGVWEEEALKQLPDGFRRFKEALLKADADGLIAEQPMESAENFTLDKITAAEFIKPFGPELKEFLDSYAQSAMGALTDDLNAMAFCNFYLAEVETRYAWEGGTVGAALHLIEQLNKHNPKTLHTGATVTRVRNEGDAVRVEWHEGGRRFSALAKSAIVTTPLKVTAAIMEDYPADRRAIVGKIRFTDFLVHTLFLSRELYTTSYDTWFGGRSFTDVIVTRWQETRGFKNPAKPGPGMLSVYQPLPAHRNADIRNPEDVADLAVAAIRDLGEMIPDLEKEARIEVESYRWPSSIHIVPPKYFSELAPQLVKPVGRVYFGGNNLGTPSFEEALYRGWRAAQEIKKKLFSVGPAKKEALVLG